MTRIIMDQMFQVQRNMIKSYFLHIGHKTTGFHPLKMKLIKG